MNEFGVLTAKVETKADVIGDTTNLPANWAEFQDSLWETLTFQWNVPTPARRDAVGLSLAIQCADVKARDIAKSEMALWRRKGRQWVEVGPGEHRLAALLATEPNGIHTWIEFWRMVILHLDLAQNAYILKGITRQGEVLELIPLPPSQVRPRVSDSGRLFYEVAATTEFERARLGGYHMIVPADRMIHLRGRMYDPLVGLSNLDLGSPIFSLVSSIARFQENLFGNDGRQQIVFESDNATFGVGDQADAAFQRLKRQLAERVRKMNTSGDPILLEAGYKAKIIAQNAREAMTAEAFNATVMRICGLMQTPPHKIFAYETVKYENMASANNQYANDCLIPIAIAIETKLRNSLLEKAEWGEFYPEFDRMTMMAGDPKTLSDILDKAVKNGAIEIDEYRDRLPLGLNPLEHDAGQVRYVPVNMAIVDRQGNIVRQAAEGQNSGQEPPADDGEDDDTPAASRGLRLIG